ncbi:MAG TPA: PoNe immunity protein domain-containing protein, partial [Ideonella sp.]|nr:PoNe immunity protein domain-containing protein [Ideonella sp.]
SRREPYYRSHTQGREHSYLGYWSFEAAAVSIVLGIDDSSYRDKDFYPRDLADFARCIGVAGQMPTTATELRLRCEAGRPCPRDGFWFTPAKANSRRHFNAGEVMPDVGGDYGATIWQWDSQQKN